MKISFYIPVLNIGGAEKVVINLLKELVNNDSIECYLLTDIKNSTWIDKIDNQVKIIDIPSDKNILSRLLSLKKAIQQNKFDAVISHLTHSNIHCLILKLFIDFKLVIVEHSITSAYLDSLSNLNGFIKKTLVKYLFNYADIIVSVSDATKNDLLRKFKIENHKCQVIYNPLDFDEIKVQSKKPINGSVANFVNGRRVLITVGRLEKLKNHAFLLDSLTEILVRNNLVLIFVGDGPEKESLLRQIETFGLQNHVLLLGFESNPYAYINQSDVLIHPSTFEGFGLVLIEAIYLKKRVISMDFETSFEVLENGRLGRIVSDKETLLGALKVNLEDHTSYIGDENSEFVESKYNLRTIANGYLKLVEGLSK